MTTPISAAGSTAAASGGPSLAAVAGGALDKNAFMKILIAQMTHQDPLNPTDGTQMATQLAQFSSVEQLMNIGNILSGQESANAALAGAVNNSSALGLLGKTVTAMSDQVVGGAHGTASVGTDLPLAGGTLSVRILNAAGVTVKTKDIGEVRGGSLAVAIDDLTTALPDGTYTIAFDLEDGTGAVTHPDAFVTTRIDGIRFGMNGALVTSGSLSFPIGTIKSVQ